MACVLYVREEKLLCVVSECGQVVGEICIIVLEAESENKRQGRCRRVDRRWNEKRKQRSCPKPATATLTP